MTKQQVKKNVLLPIAIALTIAFCSWMGATVFAISGNQKEILARVGRTEEDVKYMRQLFDDVLIKKSAKTTEIVKNENTHPGN